MSEDAQLAIRVSDVVDVLREMFPLELAEDWDNVGLLVGDETRPAGAIMTCLTLTEDVADEAAKRGAGLVVAHHPVLFRPVKTITAETPGGRALLALIEAGVSVYSPHTAFDSAVEGINARLAASLELQDVRPLRPVPSFSESQQEEAPLGSGRYGRLESPTRLGDFLAKVKLALDVEHLQYIGEDDSRVSQVAVACGAAAEFIADAVRSGCNVLLTGEARFHACLEARSSGLGLILPGHYATERPAVEQLAHELQARFPSASVWASEVERDPVRWSTP
ncbi:MAG: Nif3-like dinuclear metal center hexameric protein [Planctomycetota bacterium]|nr:MAG: Nif3-like dinuclear metal center hexameric protein [Planctomycetota bacterium]REJ88850.1 MAG: Nif3-like dinuclear metal center hexameric protein [Planctomycetota bacterium]REK25206.1 MAG: Nif3-like dinuclear metal center hexameric protein [Planctomycetota bacterium]REK32106.1 MAG: Nif3-like dinuclear metal center hexameric protein [Planctomycetota bacterium]